MKKVDKIIEGSGFSSQDHPVIKLLTKNTDIKEDEDIKKELIKFCKGEKSDISAYILYGEVKEEGGIIYAEDYGNVLHYLITRLGLSSKWDISKEDAKIYLDIILGNPTEESSGADKNAKELKKYSPDLEETHQKILKILLTQKDSYDQTPLAKAIKDSNFDIMQKLLEKSKYLKLKDDKIANYIADIESIEVIKTIFNNPQLWSKYYTNKQQLLDLAAEQGNLNLVLHLLENKGKYGVNINGKNVKQPLIEHAVRGGNVEILKHLIEEEQVKVDTTVSNGMTLLHVAAKAGKSDMVQYLINFNEININKQDIVGNTALHYALQGGNLAMAIQLLNAGAKFDIGHNTGKTALAYAVSRGYLDIVKLCLEKDPKLFDNKDNIHNVLYYAAEHKYVGVDGVTIEKYKDIIDLLISKGINISRKEEVNKFNSNQTIYRYTQSTILHYLLQINRLELSIIESLLYNNYFIYDYENILEYIPYGYVNRSLISELLPLMKDRKNDKAKEFIKLLVNSGSRIDDRALRAVINYQDQEILKFVLDYQEDKGCKLVLSESDAASLLNDMASYYSYDKFTLCFDNITKKYDSIKTREILSATMKSKDENKIKFILNKVDWDNESLNFAIKQVIKDKTIKDYKNVVKFIPTIRNLIIEDKLNRINSLLNQHKSDDKVVELKRRTDQLNQFMTKKEKHNYIFEPFKKQVDKICKDPNAPPQSMLEHLRELLNACIIALYKVIHKKPNRDKEFSTLLPQVKQLTPINQEQSSKSK